MVQARAARERAKELLSAGEDPSRVSRVEKLERQFPGDSFETVENEYIEKLHREKRAETTLEKIHFART